MLLTFGLYVSNIQRPPPEPILKGGRDLSRFLIKNINKSTFIHQSTTSTGCLKTSKKKMSYTDISSLRQQCQRRKGVAQFLAVILTQRNREAYLLRQFIGN